MESSTMRKALEEMERLSQNRETRRLADYREQELNDILQREEDAREKGIEQGIEQEKRKIAIALYADGMSTESIAKIVRLSSEKVQEMIKSIDHISENRP